MLFVCTERTVIHQYINIPGSSQFRVSKASNKEYFKNFPYKILSNTPNYSCTVLSRNWLDPMIQWQYIDKCLTLSAKKYHIFNLWTCFYQNNKVYDCFSHYSVLYNCDPTSLFSPNLVSSQFDITTQLIKKSWAKNTWHKGSKMN